MTSDEILKYAILAPAIIAAAVSWFAVRWNERRKRLDELRAFAYNDFVRAYLHVVASTRDHENAIAMAGGWAPEPALDGRLSYRVTKETSATQAVLAGHMTGLHDATIRIATYGSAAVVRQVIVAQRSSLDRAGLVAILTRMRDDFVSRADRMPAAELVDAFGKESAGAPLLAKENRQDSGFDM